MNNLQQISPEQIEALRKRVAAFPYWYHKIELPGGLITPGWAPINREAYRIPADLTGKRVLDIGAWDGFWTFEALKRGAKQVVAVDDFSDYLGQLKQDQRKAWATFDLCREVLGYDQDQCQRHELSIYDLTEARFGKFDVVFFFGTFYHLKHPFLALEKIGEVCTDEIFVESAILDDFSPYRGGIGKGYPDQMVMEFYPEDQYGSNKTNWWAPSLMCLVMMVQASGFGAIEAWKLAQKPNALPLCRGFVKGAKKKA